MWGVVLLYSYVSKNVDSIANRSSLIWVVTAACPDLSAQILRSMQYNRWAASWQNQQNMACAPSKDSDQPGHQPSLIRVFAVCMKKAWVVSYPLSAQRRLWSDWADAQADLSLRWAHMPFCWFCHEAAHIIINDPRHEETCLRGLRPGKTQTGLF